MNTASKIVRVFDGILYADAFDCALTINEIQRFSRIRISKEEIQSWMESPPVSDFIFSDSGFYYLRDRQELITKRREAMNRAAKLTRRATRIARWLQLFPFVRGIVLTGSVAANDADPEADVDLLVIVARSRLAVAFFLLGGLSRITSRSLFCPNYYLSEDHLSIKRNDFYVAREICQALPLTGLASEFFESNQWVQRELPNAGSKHNLTNSMMGSSLLQKSIELFCRLVLHKTVSSRLDSLAKSRLAHHYQVRAVPVPESVKAAFEAGKELRFHNPNRVDDAMRSYQRNQQAFLDHIEQSKSA